MRILHAHAPALDAQDAVRLVAELKDIAGETLDREIFVHGADPLRLRLQHYFVVGRVRNRATGSNCGQARAAARAQHAVDRIAVQIGRARPTPRRVALGEHAHNFAEAISGQIHKGISARNQFEQFCFVPFATGDFSDDLLREHVERIAFHMQRIEFATAHGIEQGSALDQIVARLRKQTTLRCAVDGVAGTADALQKRRNRTR